MSDAFFLLRPSSRLWCGTTRHGRVRTRARPRIGSRPPQWRPLAIHPGSTTHGQLNAAQQAAAGISPSFVRLSVGLEDPDDIIADIAQSLEGIALLKAAE